MSLSPRHRWCVNRIVECFQSHYGCNGESGGSGSEGDTSNGSDGGSSNEDPASSSSSSPSKQQQQSCIVIDDATVQAFLRRPAVLARFNALFAGDGSPSLFVHCQPLLEDIENIDANTFNSMGGTDVASIGGGVRLFLSDGAAPDNYRGECYSRSGGNGNATPSASTATIDKFCYFVRQGKSVDPNEMSDTSLLYGEIIGSPLESIRALLQSGYSELFAVSREWGKAGKDKRSELTNEVDRFVQGLTAALESMEGGLVLRRPCRDQLDLCRVDDKSNVGAATLPGGSVVIGVGSILGGGAGI